MPVSNILEIPILSESMAQKTIAVNMALQAMEQAISATLEVVTTTATVAGFDLVIPFNETNDLSAREALRAIQFKLLAGATENFDLIHPPNPHLFIVTNNTTKTARVKTVEPGADTVTVPAGATWLLICDGENVTRMNFTLTTLKQAHDYDIGFWGKPADAEVIARFFVGRETTFPANFASSSGHVGVNPVATRTFTVKDDATTIGTFTVSDAGVFAFTTSGGTEKVVGAGSILTVVNQAGAADTLMTDIEVCLLGSINVTQPYP